MTELDADVAVVGSGFGGTLTALVADRIGPSAVVVDRAVHPRFAVGESSTPTANMILRDLADRYGLERLRPLVSHGPWREAYPELGVGRKRGFAYFRHRPGREFEPEPDHGSELLVAASSDPYRSDTHWLRADVDAFLAGEVRRAGIPILEGTEVTGATRGDRWEIRARGPDGPARVRADFLVDATGRGGLLPGAGFTGPSAAGELNTRSRALYTHFSGLPRWRDAVAAIGVRTGDHPFPCDESALHHVLDDGWCWELRFDDGRVSAGLVLDEGRRERGDAVRPAGGRGAPEEGRVSSEEEWRRRMARYPALSRRFGGARIVDPPGRIVRTSRLQRLAGRAAGPGWALLPFTAGFVDPLHSTGIAHTLSGVERLAALLEAHGSPPPEHALERYGREVRDEIRFVDELVAPCYRALPSFRGWVASTKLYFAAVTGYERERAGRGSGSGAGPEVRFLRADEAGLRRAAREALETLEAWPADGRPPPERVAAYERFVEESLRPYDRVGLFDPDVPRMHPHAAAPT